MASVLTCDFDTREKVRFQTKDENHTRDTFLINDDGTICLEKEPNLVLGTDKKSILIQFVQKGSKYQFVFDQTAKYLENLRIRKKKLAS